MDDAQTLAGLFSGEITPEQADAPEFTSPGAPQVEAEVEAPVEPVAEQVEEAPAKEEASAKEEAEAPQEEAPVEYVTTLAELAESTETDIATLFDLQLDVEGEEEPVTVKALRDSYRSNQAALAKQSEYAVQQEKHETDARQGREAVEQQMNIAAAVLQTQANAIAASMKTPEMERLRVDNPGEWAAKEAEVKGHMENYQNQYNSLNQQYQEFTQKRQDTFLQTEGAKLEREVDGWNQDKLTTAVETMYDLGFTETELPNIMDSRFVKAALELGSLRAEIKELRAGKEAGVKAAKAVKKLPKKVLRPKGSPVASQGKAVQDNLRSRTRKFMDSESGNEDEAMDIIRLALS